MVEAGELRGRTLGAGRIASPLSGLTSRRGPPEHTVDEADRVLFDDTLAMLAARNGDEPPSFEPGGPRRKIFLDGSASSPAAASARVSTTSSAAWSSS